MMKAKLSLHLISFYLVRRENWFIKISVYKNKQILIFMQHVYDVDKIFIKCLTDQNAAADFIENIIKE